MRIEPQGRTSIPCPAPLGWGRVSCVRRNLITICERKARLISPHGHWQGPTSSALLHWFFFAMLFVASVASLTAHMADCGCFAAALSFFPPGRRRRDSCPRPHAASGARACAPRSRRRVAQQHVATDLELELDVLRRQRRLASAWPPRPTPVLLVCCGEPCPVLMVHPGDPRPALLVRRGPVAREREGPS